MATAPRITSRVRQPTTFGAWTPFVQPTRPPAGFYDPSLDAQERAGNRGLAQLLADSSKEGARAESGYLLDAGDVNRRSEQSLADLLRNRDREGTDFSTRMTRSTEDHGRQIADISRSFQRLGARQAQSAEAAGLGNSGAFAAAAGARRENEALAREPVDTNFNRAQADANVAHARFGEDSGQQEGRVTEARDLQLGRLGTQFGYGEVDRSDAARRAGEENTFFGQDLNAQRLFQAGQAGYVAPKGPSNEFRDAAGNPYRVLIRGGQAVRVDQHGNRISSRPRAGR